MDKLCTSHQGSNIFIFDLIHSKDITLQRRSSEKAKQIFPEKELCALNPNFHIHVSVSDLYIPTMGLPILLQENMWTDP
jgi:hypothetical protein